MRCQSFYMISSTFFTGRHQNKFGANSFFVHFSKKRRKRKGPWAGCCLLCRFWARCIYEDTITGKLEYRYVVRLCCLLTAVMFDAVFGGSHMFAIVGAKFPSDEVFRFSCSV